MNHRLTVGLVGVCLAAVGGVRAQPFMGVPIPVQNFSFEMASLSNPNGNLLITSVPGWDTTTGGVGIYWPSAAQYSGTTTPGSPGLPAVGIPDGKQVAHLRGGLMSQDNVGGITIQPGHQYTLIVDVGQPFGTPKNPANSYTIALDAAGTNFPYAKVSFPQPPLGFFTNSKPIRPFTSPHTSFMASKSTFGGLKIVLFSQPGVMTDFDNVQLLDDASGEDPINKFVPHPTAAANSFQIVYQGDVRSNINLDATAKDEAVNPFAYADKHFGANLGTATVTATLNGSGNTVVTYSGPRAIQPTDTFPFGLNEPHFGIDGIALTTGGTPLKELSTGWVAGSPQAALPGLTLAGPDLTNPINGFVTVYADVTSNGLTVGEWFEVPVTAIDQDLSFANYMGMSETLSNVGFLTSNTEIPLDQLNWPNEPPTGQLGSRFTALPDLDGLTLQPGGSVVFHPAPEPGTICLLGALLAASGTLVRFRRSPRR